MKKGDLSCLPFQFSSHFIECYIIYVACDSIKGPGCNRNWRAAAL